MKVRGFNAQLDRTLQEQSDPNNNNKKSSIKMYLMFGVGCCGWMVWLTSAL